MLRSSPTTPAGSPSRAFLRFLLASILLHAALIALLLKLPATPIRFPEEAVTVDLRDLLEAPASLPAGPPPSRPIQTPTRHAPSPPVPVLPLPRVPTAVAPPTRPARPLAPAPEKPATTPVAPQPAPGGDLFRSPAERQPVASPQLFPTAQGLAKIENEYRGKYSDKVASGEAKFLDTDDLVLGSFLRRFEDAVYGVWRYPTEAARTGAEGTGFVAITFNRKGEIEEFKLLESTGSAILDGEIRRTLRAIGPPGPLPKAYPRDHFVLLASFRYTIGGKPRLR